MATRKIVKIDEEKCNGCGLCIPNCAEGALKIIDGKARLISDIFCDGLGACLGHCPEDAIVITEREAEAFDEKAVEALLHKTHGIKPQPQPKHKPQPASFSGCPSSRTMQFKMAGPDTRSTDSQPSASMLSHWPIQLKLVPVNAPYFKDADLLVVADCVPFAYPDFHRDFLKGKAVVVGCPKLDDVEYYIEKLTEIFKTNSIRSITLPHMEVPCCFGLVRAVEEALKASGKTIPLKKVKVGIQGEIKPEKEERVFHHPRVAGCPH
jgi:Pyruvate/2-oxoacid:ferredoxin oxidoreductase delta subunit